MLPVSGGYPSSHADSRVLYTAQVPEGQWDGIRQAILQMCATSSRSSKPAIYGGQILGDTVGLRAPMREGKGLGLGLFCHIAKAAQLFGYWVPDYCTQYGVP